MTIWAVVLEQLDSASEYLWSECKGFLIIGNCTAVLADNINFLYFVILPSDMEIIQTFYVSEYGLIK